MNDKVDDLLLFCSNFAFGTVNLAGGVNQFCGELDNEVISLCKSLPESTQTDALLFLMQYFQIPFGQELSIFINYYVPAWSIIYWLIKSHPGSAKLEERDIKNAKTAHSMALLLHPMDDHLNDNELKATHLALLLRSQSWMIMNNAFDNLAAGTIKGEEIVHDFLDDYYSNINSSEEITSIDGYCDRFRKQMATWLIVPVLMAKKLSPSEETSHDIQKAYESFGIAWRLLDDINDVQADIIKGAHSAIYFCLPKNVKKCWDKHRGEELDEKNGSCKIILDSILKYRVMKILVERIRSELNLAVAIAKDHNMKNWAEELNCLLRPLKNARTHFDR